MDSHSTGLRLLFGKAMVQLMRKHDVALQTGIMRKRGKNAQTAYSFGNPVRHHSNAVALLRQESKVFEVPALRRCAEDRLELLPTAP